jgi:hypothetical protein
MIVMPTFLNSVSVMIVIKSLGVMIAWKFVKSPMVLARPTLSKCCAETVPNPDQGLLVLLELEFLKSRVISSDALHAFIRQFCVIDGKINSAYSAIYQIR